MGKVDLDGLSNEDIALEKQKEITVDEEDKFSPQDDWDDEYLSSHDNGIVDYN